MFVPFAATQPSFKLHFGPPEASAPHVVDFCTRIRPGSVPLRLPIQPDVGCLPRECFHNVRQKTEREGGRIRFGWAIWDWPRVYIEAEHHAVHEDENGLFTDVTPSTEGDTQVARLFLIDDSATFDFQTAGTVWRDNIRTALTDDLQINEY